MTTERLYYNEPNLLEFEAEVIGTLDLGDRTGVLLNRTAFYPTSGGQPNDLGTLGGVALVDCYEDEKSGDIVHVLAGKPTATQVHCQVDADRRRDHMQQHSGQHVLSRAFVELYDWPTVSFHLGVVTCTIDLAVDSASRDQLERVEDLANRIVQENRAVAIRDMNEDNIAEAGLRKATERTGEIRVIDVSGYDRSACGGTHVRSTHEIGPILITGVSRAKKQTRVEFICGNRVLRHARAAHRALESISQTISSPLLETPSAVVGVWQEFQQAKKRIEELEAKLLDHEAAAFPLDENGYAIAAFKDRGIETLKMLAARIAKRPGTVVLFADQSDQLRVVFARAADSAVDVSALLKKTIEKFGGRGGGRPEMAQAGGLNASSAEEVMEFATQILRPVSNEPPLVDIEKLRELTDNEAPLLQEFTQMYVTQTQEALAGLDAAVASKDFPTIRRLAHKYYGSSASLAAYAAATRLKELEVAADTLDPTLVESLWRETRKTLELTCNFLLKHNWS
jgi:alanyl-tRNA synthetase